MCVCGKTAPQLPTTSCLCSTWNSSDHNTLEPHHRIALKNKLASNERRQATLFVGKCPAFADLLRNLFSISYKPRAYIRGPSGKSFRTTRHSFATAPGRLPEKPQKY